MGSVKLSQQHIAERYEWLESLESGEWPQGQDELCNRDGFCCLGVAAAIGLATPEDHRLAVTVETFAGFNDADMGMFATLNDDEGLSFDEIAEIIEITILRGIDVKEAYGIWQEEHGTLESEEEDDDK